MPYAQPATPERQRTSIALGLALALSGTGLLHAAEPTPSLEQILERLQRIEARLGESVTESGTDVDLATLARRLAAIEARLIDSEQRERATTSAAPPAASSSAPKVSVGSRGASVQSADGRFDFKLRGTVQADGRWFDDDVGGNDGFLFRRIRPSLEGSLGELVAFRITPELAGDSSSIVDAYVDLRFDPAYTVRIGKVKGPIGLERLQSASALAFIERGFPTELAPNRDIGVQVQGALASNRFNYTVGLYNGAPDGRDSPGSNPDDHFEFAARVFVEPFAGRGGALSGLGFGLAASHGDREGSGNNVLPRYRTPGQATFFNYRDGAATTGRQQRWSPQAYWYHGPLGLLGEYIVSRQHIELASNPDATDTLSHRAWQLVAGWVLTGEKASYRGVTPAQPFSRQGGWGAFEVVGRYGELDIDDDAFPLLADPLRAASQARSWGLGVNWYLSENLKLVLNHTRTGFDGGASNGGDRTDEKTLFSRVSVAF